MQTEHFELTLVSTNIFYFIFTPIGKYIIL